MMYGAPFSGGNVQNLPENPGRPLSPEEADGLRDGYHRMRMQKHGVDGFQLIDSIREHYDLAQRHLEAMREHGKAKAEAERAYRTAKAEYELREVVENKRAISLAVDMARGDSEVSALKAEWDCAEADYETDKLAHHLEKNRAAFLEQLYNAEWRSTK